MPLGLRVERYLVNILKQARFIHFLPFNGKFWSIFGCKNPDVRFLEQCL